MEEGNKAHRGRRPGTDELIRQNLSKQAAWPNQTLRGLGVEVSRTTLLLVTDVVPPPPCHHIIMWGTTDLSVFPTVSFSGLWALSSRYCPMASAPKRQFPSACSIDR